MNEQEPFTTPNPPPVRPAVWKSYLLGIVIAPAGIILALVQASKAHKLGFSRARYFSAAGVLAGLMLIGVIAAASGGEAATPLPPLHRLPQPRHRPLHLLLLRLLRQPLSRPRLSLLRPQLPRYLLRSSRPWILLRVTSAWARAFPRKACSSSLLQVLAAGSRRQMPSSLSTTSILTGMLRPSMPLRGICKWEDLVIPR